MTLNMRRLKMNNNDWLFAKLPNWLRWILSLPVAILGYLILQFILSFIIHNIFGWSYQNVIVRSIVIFAGVYSFIIFFFYCLPKHKEGITGVASILLSIYYFISIILNIVNGFVWDSENIAYGISAIVCIYIAVKKLLNKDSKGVFI